MRTRALNSFCLCWRCFILWLSVMGETRRRLSEHTNSSSCAPVDEEQASAAAGRVGEGRLVVRLRLRAGRPPEDEDAPRVRLLAERASELSRDMTAHFFEEPTRTYFVWATIQYYASPIIAGRPAAFVVEHTLRSDQYGTKAMMVTSSRMLVAGAGLLHCTAALYSTIPSPSFSVFLFFFCVLVIWTELPKQDFLPLKRSV